MKPLYIWAGGKNKMIPKYQAGPGIPLNGYDTYIEPFFGGGAMMIYIYQNNPTVKKFVLNDINPEIVGIYTAIKNDVQNFINRVDSLEAAYLPLTKEERKKFYYALREEYTTKWSKWSPVDDSATLYFLMKTGFNGIWQTTKTSNGRYATPSGLLNQVGSVYDKANVLEWNLFLQKVTIRCGDWTLAVNESVGKTFFFFDPPYRDSFTSYSQVFNDSHQLALIDFCKQQDLDGNLVMFCNRDAGDDFYTSNQGQLKLSYYDVTYTAGRRKQNKSADGAIETQTAKPATEILLYSNAKEVKIKSKKLVQFANSTTSLFEQI
jgi:DNA adenine methylase